MPFKRNPVMSEKICSLARQVAAFLDVAWENAASAMLERSLDDSANRRSMIPESFLATDELLRTAAKVITGLEWDPDQIQRQLEHFGPFAAQERVLTALVGEGADRGEMHERLRLHAKSAWESLRQGDENPLAELIASDTGILQYLQPARILQLMEASDYTGLASERAEQFATELRAQLAEPA
jgi:adenylosuccinate lyase